ncbi:MAG: hypothetical protein K2X93_10535 [Candidatus Obscuribacterales bacterium]|nr:hypothetical protein [Candidatus Obscuribacterales bacterium]
MRFDAPTRATVAVSLGVFALSALVSNFLLRLFLGLLKAPAQTGLEKEIIGPQALFIISALIGLVMTVLCFVPILKHIRERGLPGLIPSPDPFDRKFIRVSLTVKGNDESYSQWVPAHHVHNLMKGAFGKKLTLARNGNERLILVRNEEPSNEDGDTILVKQKKAGKVLFNMELVQGTQGLFESDSERDYATCYYEMAFIGCDGQRGFLKFGGEVRVMKLVFLD